jgi:hypothetical protein
MVSRDNRTGQTNLLNNGLTERALLVFVFDARRKTFRAAIFLCLLLLVCTCGAHTTCVGGRKPQQDDVE